MTIGVTSHAIKRMRERTGFKREKGIRNFFKRAVENGDFAELDIEYKGDRFDKKGYIYYDNIFILTTIKNNNYTIVTIHDRYNMTM